MIQVSSFFSSFADENSILYLVARFWLPPIMAVIIGGFAAAVVFPRLQTKYLNKRQRDGRRLELQEDILANLNKYAIAWRRLSQLSTYLCENNIETDFYESRKREFAADRNKIKDDLFSDIARFRIYAVGAQSQVLEEFVSWDESVADAELENLPHYDEWRAWYERVCASFLTP